MRQDMVEYSTMAGAIYRDFSRMAKIMARHEADEQSLTGWSRFKFVRHETKRINGLSDQFLKAAVGEMVHAICEKRKPKDACEIFAGIVYN